jgi:type IV pilus assembly protein PilO
VKVNIRELTFENISIWPTSIKALVIGLCCCLILCVGFSLWLQPALVELKLAQQQEQNLREEFALKQHQAVNLNAYHQQLLVMQKMFASMLQQLPNSTEIPGLLDDISKAGVASGLEFTLFKPQPEKPRDFYFELPIQISVQGSYHQLAHFISQVSALPRIVTLQDFSIIPLSGSQIANNSPLLKMEVMAKTYGYAKGK